MKFLTRVLAILALCSIAGCVKAKKDYDDYISYHNSLGGAVSDFAQGYSGAAQGDPFGPALSIADEGNSLEETKSNWQYAAWGFSVAVIFISMARKSPA